MQINPRPTLLEVGGKAYQLCRLKQWCNVSPFFIITFENSHAISDPVNQREIIEQCRNQGLDIMAVRSSASCEDSLQTSFAGMFRTVLCVQPSGLVDAISQVLNSVFDRRVADYCQAQGLAQDRIKMAVIVQKMVNSRVSGVCFTRLQSDNNCLLVEACYGLGEALVSGKVTPDSYVVDRSSLSIVKESVGYQKVILRMVTDSEKPAYEEVPFYKRNAKKLTYNEVRVVAETCLIIEKRFGFVAADVEWSFEGNVLYILQARPYTGFDITEQREL